MSRRVRRALIIFSLPVVAVAALSAWAAIAEPGVRVGEALQRAPQARAYAEAEQALWRRYGVDARPRTLELRDPAMRVHVVEVPGEGVPVVLVHGGGGTAAQWAPLLPELAGRHLFLVDRPGCGLTDGFAYDGVEVRRHAVRFLGAVLDALAVKKAVLLGNSMGGLWSLWFAGAHPERVEALMLAGCPALFLGTSAPGPMRLMAVPGVGQAMMAVQPGGAEGVRQVLVDVAGPRAAANADPLLLEAAAWGNAIPGSGRSFRTLVQRALTPWGPRAEMAFGEDDLARVKAPLLLVWGREDVFGEPSAIDRARKVRPDLVAEVIGGGHLPWLDDAAACGRAMRGFLETRGPLEEAASVGAAELR